MALIVWTSRGIVSGRRSTRAPPGWAFSILISSTATTWNTRAGNITGWVLEEGYEATCELKREGGIGGLSLGNSPRDLWRCILCTLDIVAGLVHNHYCPNDTSLIDLLPIASARGDRGDQRIAVRIRPSDRTRSRRLASGKIAYTFTLPQQPIRMHLSVRSQIAYNR